MAGRPSWPCCCRSCRPSTLLAFPVIPQFVLEGYGRTVVEASPVGEEALQGRIERFEDADPVTQMVRALDTDNPVAIVIFALVPVAISIIAASALTKPTRSRTLLISAMVAAVYTFLTGAIGVYFFLGVICLGWASFQSRKADAMVAAAADDRRGRVRSPSQVRRRAEVRG